MNDADAWVHWWAFAWRHAHPHWLPLDAPPALTRSQAAGASNAFGIAPCLPAAPTFHLMQLVLAQPSQHDAMLQRVNHICRPMCPTQLDATQRLWCQRLAKALRPQDWLLPDDDALQLLRAWVEPPVWQRLRLRFAPERIRALELKPLPAILPGKLRILWQAVVWYEVHSHAVTPHN